MVTSLEFQQVDYDVVIVGAGISGIAFAYRLQEKNPDLTYCILEARHEIGGTWSLFQYPGIRSDSDLFTFGFPWRPWQEKTAIARGSKIVEYLKECAAHEGIDRKMKFNHHVNRAQWSTTDKTWTLNVTADGNGDSTKVLRTRFLLFGTGYYDYQQGLKAEIPGMQNFQGLVVHPQFWPADLAYADKEVVIIGSGATAITLLPSIASTASHVIMLQRSPSYIMTVPSEDVTEKAIRFVCPKTLAVKLIRYKWMMTSFLLVSFCQSFPKMARWLFRWATKSQLPPDMALDPDFTPRNGKASVQTGLIDTVTPNTIRLQSGQELVPDIIVTATGLKLRVGGGVQLVVDGEEFRIQDHFLWNGAMLEGLPNSVFAFGLLSQMKKKHASMIVPQRSEEERARMGEKPFLKLSSTYVKEGQSDLPKTGDRGPWRRRSYYWKDILIAWYGNINKGLDWS
ncbi:hypothetical protein CLAIMM_11178 [Cladophialophora immunda]|nr:hypothetical protein CLAIMM_11178 [Cladophialophora immunda]